MGYISRAMDPPRKDPVSRVASLFGPRGSHEADGQNRSGSNGEPKRRLFMLAAALVARGVAPEEAYDKALHYTQGAGRGRNWINALAEHDREAASADEP